MTLDLIALYDDLDARLERREEYYPRHEEPEWGLLQEALAVVTERLWVAASPEAGRHPPSELESFADRPIFVVGYYKSGTTLLLNLLDGHPDLLALPGESRHFTSLADLGPTRKDDIRRLHAHWIRNTITPYGLPPRWLLGRPAENGSDPYDAFGRTLVGFARAQNSRDLLGAAAQALAVMRGASPQYWVEKTPLHELEVNRILSAYPEARFVHIVRDPCSTLDSIAHYGTETPIVDVLAGAAELSRSFDAAIVARRELGDRYTVIRYETLVTDTQHTMSVVAAALGISYNECLLVPTTLGMPATANAGRPEHRVSGMVHARSLERASGLSRRDRLVVDALVGGSARELGYGTHRPSRAVALAARTALFTRYRIAPALRR